jgi:hypothetical protein
MAAPLELRACTVCGRLLAHGHDAAERRVRLVHGCLPAEPLVLDDRDLAAAGVASVAELDRYIHDRLAREDDR